MRSEWIIHLVSRLRDRMQDALSAELAAEGIDDIVPAHAGVLFALGAGVATMSELAAALGRSNSTLTALVQKLEDLGYVQRFRSQEDQRVQLVKLTARGVQGRRATVRGSRRTLARLYRGVSRGDRRQLIDGLLRLYRNLED